MTHPNITKFYNQQEHDYEIDYDNLYDAVVHVTAGQEGNRLGNGQTPAYIIGPHVVSMD